MISCPHCNAQNESGEICTECGKGLFWSHHKGRELPSGTLVSGKGHTYSIGTVLAASKMGITYSAMDIASNRKVVLKEYFPWVYGSRAEDGTTVQPAEQHRTAFLEKLRYFTTQADILMHQRDLPSLVHAITVFRGNGTAYLVTEYLEGTMLPAYLQQMGGKLPAQQVLDGIKPLIRDLFVLHQRRVIHRDIGPDNLMVMPDGSFKLLDFGTCYTKRERQALWRGEQVGFAPIDIQAGRQTPGIDVYSIAAVLYYCITGVIPLDAALREKIQAQLEKARAQAERDAQNAEGNSAASAPQEEDKLVPPTALGADLTPAQEQVVLKGLDRQGAYAVWLSRPKTMRELYRLLYGEEPQPVSLPVEEEQPIPGYHDFDFCPHCLTPNVYGKTCPVCGGDLSMPGHKDDELPAGTILRHEKEKYWVGAVLRRTNICITYNAVHLGSLDRVEIAEYYPLGAVRRGSNGKEVQSLDGEKGVRWLGRCFCKDALMSGRLPSIRDACNRFYANSTAYVVTPYQEGISLQEYMQQLGRPIPAPQLLEWLEPVIRDLDALHSRWLVHGDICPDNLILKKDGTIALIGYNSVRFSTSGDAICVPREHFSPVEYYRGSYLSIDADDYSMAAVIYYCTTGVLPPSMKELAEGAVPQSPIALGADLTETQEAAILWALSVQRQARPRKGEFLDALYNEKLPQRPAKPAAPPRKLWGSRCPHCFQKAGSGDVCPQCGKSLLWSNGKDELPAGTVLRNGAQIFRIGAVLQRNNFTITYSAMEARTQQRAAITEYFPAVYARRAEDGITVQPTGVKQDSFQHLRHRFAAEANALLQQKDLTGIAKVLASFSGNGTVYCAEEHLDGVSLRESMQQCGGTIPAPELLEKLVPVLRDLGTLHGKDVLHRAISPDCLFRMPDGSIKLTGFNRVRYLGKHSSMTCSLIPGFSPIEFTDSYDHGPWSDLYSLAAVFYYCTTGILPPSAPDRVQLDSLQPPISKGVVLTSDQEKAILWALKVRTEDRPQSVRDFYRLLYAPYPPQPLPPSPPPKAPEDQPFRISRYLEKKPSKWEQIKDKIIGWLLD